MASVVGK